MTKGRIIWFLAIPIFLGIVLINEIFLAFLLWVMFSVMILISIVKPIHKLGFVNRVHALISGVLVTIVPLLIYIIFYITFATSEPWQEERLISACTDLFRTEINLAQGLYEDEKTSTCTCYYKKYYTDMGPDIEDEIDRWESVVNLDQFFNQVDKTHTEFDELETLKSCRSDALK